MSTQGKQQNSRSRRKVIEHETNALYRFHYGTMKDCPRCKIVKLFGGQVFKESLRAGQSITITETVRERVRRKT